jgi:bacterioferritin
VDVPSVPYTDDNRTMLENALQAEIDTIKRYTLRIDQAEKAGEVAVKVELENLVVDESRHRDDIRRMLKDWR